MTRWSPVAARGLRKAPIGLGNWVIRLAGGQDGPGKKRQPSAAGERRTELAVPCDDPHARSRDENVPVDADAEAVRRCLQGDVEAFEGIVEHWKGPLFRLALRYAHDRESAEDLCQDIFLHAFRGLRSWRGEARFSTWLIALATNVCRSHARRRPPPEPVDLGGVLEPAAPAAAAAAVPAERVQRAVNALPAHYRDALHLYYFHGADVAQAAVSLGVPQGTLKARLARGRRLLRRALGDPT